MRLTRVNGPYVHHGGYKIVLVDLAGNRTTIQAKTEAEAVALCLKLRRANNIGIGPTVGEFFAAYLADIAEVLKPNSLKTVGFRLKSLGLDSEKPLVHVTAAQCEKAVVKLKGTTDTRKNTLSELRKAMRWGIKRKIVAKDLTEGLEVKGNRNRGKSQLRIDEARQWLQACLDWAEDDSKWLAPAICLLLGLRASETCGIQARDVDAGATLLWINGTKTQAAQRRVELPEILRPLLEKAVKGLKPTDRVFPISRHVLLGMTRKACRLAGLPIVGPQSMRGLHATLAVSGGASADTVTRQLGHRSFETTKRSYAKPEALRGASISRVDAILGNSVGNSDNSHRS